MIRPSKFALVALALTGAACGPSTESEAPAEASAPTFETAVVVERAVTELTLRLEAEERRAAELRGEPAADLEDRTLGLVSVAAGRDKNLARVAQEEVRQLGAHAVPHLMQVVADEDEAWGDASRAAAVQLLASLDGPAAAEVLAATLEGSAPGWLKSLCAWQLGETTQDWLLPRLLLRLKYETDPQTVVWLARTLGRFDNYAGVDGLAGLLGSDEEGVRNEAYGVLAELLERTGSADVDALRRAWWSGDAGAPAAGAEPSVRRQLETWRAIHALREWQLRGVDDARFVLARMGPWAAERLGRALTDEDPYVRIHSGQCLERMGPRGRVAAPRLVAALNDPHQAAQAAAALGGVCAGAAESDPERAAEVFGELAPRLGPEHPLELRMAAARSLGLVGDERARPPLAMLLAESEPIDLRAAAAEGLVRLGPTVADAPAVRLLAELMSSPAIDPAVPERALHDWLASKPEDEGFADALERWLELGASTRDVAFPDVELVRERRSARAQLVRERLDALLR